MILIIYHYEILKRHLVWILELIIKAFERLKNKLKTASMQFYKYYKNNKILFITKLYNLIL